jgi:hypothetical protein
LASAQTSGGGSKSAPAGVTGTREAIFDAWLAADAAVTGTYRGADSVLGPLYHVIDVDDVWMGTPARGRLVFKAPRSVRGQPGSRLLLFFWDRLAGASDSFLEESKSRYAADVWRKIGPDSSAVFLLPFSAWSYPYSGDKLLLRGQSAFPTELSVHKLRNDLQKYDESLQPRRLYAGAAAAARVRVTKSELGERTAHGQVVERWVLAEFRRLESFKGDVPETFQLRFISVPRSPRFKQGDEVILLLARGPEGLFLDQGKRGVLHVVNGEVLEAGQPLAEFVKAMRGS